MTEYHDIHSYVTIEGKDFDPAVITARLGIRPFDTQSYDSQWWERFHVGASWSGCYCTAERQSVAQMLRNTLAPLVDRPDELTALCAELSAESVLSIVPKLQRGRVMPLIELPAEVLSFCHRTHTLVSIDLYLFDPTSHRKFVDNSPKRRSTCATHLLIEGEIAPETIAQALGLDVNEVVPVGDRRWAVCNYTRFNWYVDRMMMLGVRALDCDKLRALREQYGVRYTLEADMIAFSGGNRSVLGASEEVVAWCDAVGASIRYRVSMLK